MGEKTGISNLAGTAGSLMAIAGVAGFFLGIFGPVRNVIFIGLALILLSFAAFFIEELGDRRQDQGRT